MNIYEHPVLLGAKTGYCFVLTQSHRFLWAVIPLGVASDGGGWEGKGGPSWQRDVGRPSAICIPGLGSGGQMWVVRPLMFWKSRSQEGKNEQRTYQKHSKAPRSWIELSPPINICCEPSGLTDNASPIGQQALTNWDQMSPSLPSKPLAG